MVTLQKYPVIVRQRPAVGGVYLAKAGVQVVAPSAGRAIDDLQVQRREEDHVHLPHHVHGSFGDAVDLEALLCRPRVRGEKAQVGVRQRLVGRRGRCLGCVAEQGDFNAQGALGFLHVGHQAGEGQGLAPGGPVDQLSLGGGAVGARGGQEVQGLQQVALPLGVVPHDDAHLRG